MSVRIMTLVWEVDLPDSEKIVLLALADCANDEGLCWPSMATLARKCSKSDRTVQAAIKALGTAGHLSREERPGKGCLYTVHPNGTPEIASPPKPFRGEMASPPKRTTPTPEAASDKPSRTITPPDKADALSTPDGGSGQAGDEQFAKNAKKPRPAAQPKRKRAVGSRLAADWEAPAVADLSLAVQSIVAQWPDGAYALVAVQFRNHWRSEGRAIGAKRDWKATWENWLMRESASILRAAKAGQRFDAAAVPAKPARRDPAEERAIAALEAQAAGEGEAMARIRQLVKAEVGTASYGAWLKETALRCSGGDLVVLAASSFKSGWVEQHFGAAIERAARSVIGQATGTRFGVVRPPGLPKAA